MQIKVSEKSLKWFTDISYGFEYRVREAPNYNFLQTRFLTFIL